MWSRLSAHSRKVHCDLATHPWSMCPARETVQSHSTKSIKSAWRVQITPRTLPIIISMEMISRFLIDLVLGRRSVLFVASAVQAIRNFKTTTATGMSGRVRIIQDDVTRFASLTTDESSFQNDIVFRRVPPPGRRCDPQTQSYSTSPDPLAILALYSGRNPNHNLDQGFRY